MSMMQIITGNCLEEMKKIGSESIDCVVTSPPYWALRKYGNDSNELGQEKTFQEYVAKLIEVFDEVKRVLKKDGTCWINIADTYISKGATRHMGYADPKNTKAGVKNYVEPSALPQTIQKKSLANIPHRVAIAMTDRGWIHRNTIIWYKRNAMPSSVKDRFTCDYEFIFFFTKSKKYYFEQQFEPYTQSTKRWGGYNLNADGQSKWDNGTGQNTYRNRNLRPNPNGKNMRCVWDIPTKPSDVPHFAMYPEALAERMIKAGCPQNGIVLDPFAGAGNTLTAAKKLNRGFIGIELYPKYIDIISKRINNTPEKLL